MCRPKALRTAILFAVIVATLALDQAAGEASEPLVTRVSILERGIYSAESTGLTAAVGTLGAVQHVRRAKLVESTTRIPGRKLVRFGVRYVVHGSPRGAEAEIRMITRLPESELASVLDNRLRHSQSEFKVSARLGSVAYREFLFDDVREVIPGEWVFEFWFGARKIGEQKFCVYDVEVEHPIGRDGCSTVVALVP